MLFTFPSRYSSAIGHRRVFRLGGWSPQLPTGFHVSGGTQEPVGSPCGFAYGALTLSRRPSQAVPLPRGFVTARRPALQPRRGRSARRFGLFPVRSPLLGESRLISLPLGTEMFQFPRLPPPRLCVRRGVPGLWSRRVRPFGDPRVWRACAPNRGLSQLVTSFVGFQCQGIHRVPLPSSLRWLRYIHTPRRSPAGAIRCDLLLKENIVFVTLCSSQGTAGQGPGDRTLRARARRKGTSAGMDGTRPCVVSSLLEEVLSLERR